MGDCSFIRFLNLLLFALSPLPLMPFILNPFLLNLLVASERFEDMRAMQETSGSG